MFPLGSFSQPQTKSLSTEESPTKLSPLIPPVRSRERNSVPYRYQTLDPNFENGNTKKPEKMATIENKSFLDSFDNNNSTFLNQDKSHARNLKGRLLNNQDPSAQRAKEEKMKAYRQDLAKQMEADRQRKLKEKKELEEEQLKRQKQFYQKIKFEAQQKQQKEKEGPAYYMRKTKKNNFVQSQQKPKISKKAYKNQTLDESRKKTINLDESKTQQQSVEEERISRLLIFQENMLKKLDVMKNEIRSTSSHLEVDREIQRVRLKLRNHPMQFSKPQQKPQLTFNDFYTLPRRNIAPKFQVKLNDRRRASRELGRKNHTVLEQMQKKNDKNFQFVAGEEEENPEQANE